MAHFAQLNENNVVTQVLVVPNEEEHRGQAFLAIDLGLGGTWVQTSYNANIRGKYAGPGDIYDAENDEFVPRPLTEEELAEITAAEQKAAEEAARLSAKLAIYAKLGLTEEEINTLIS
jgi:hypothetical protein